MRVCILIKATLRHCMGGMQVHCDILAKGLTRLGHEVTILTTSHPEGSIEEKDKSGFRTVFISDAPAGKDSGLWLRRSLEFIERNRSSIDVIFSESFAAAGYARVRRRIGIPLVVFIHGFWLDYIRDQWNEAHSLADLVRWLFVRIPLALWGVRYLEAPCVRNADRCIAASKEIQKRVMRGYHLPPDRVEFIPNGVRGVDASNGSEDRLVNRRRLNLPAQAMIAAVSCVLYRQKGVHVAIKAFQMIQDRYPGLMLLIIGDGPDASELRGAAGGIPRIQFVGQVPHNEVAAYLQASDMFLCPTLRVEGLPFAALEALGAGLPVVASRIGGLKEVVEEGINGFLVPPGDVSALAQGMVKIIEDPGKRREMGGASRDRFLKDYTADRMVDRMVRVLEQVLPMRTAEGSRS